MRLADLPSVLEPALIEEARRIGIGLHSVTSLYDPAIAEAQSDRLSLVMGYSALEIRQIERGVELLAQAVASVKGRLDERTR